MRLTASKGPVPNPSPGPGRLTDSDRLKAELLSSNLPAANDLNLRPNDWRSYAMYASPRQETGYRKRTKDAARGKMLPYVPPPSRPLYRGVQDPQPFRGPSSARSEHRALSHLVDAVRCYQSNHNDPPLDQTGVKLPPLSKQNIEQHNKPLANSSSTKEDDGLDLEPKASVPKELYDAEIEDSHQRKSSKRNFGSNVDEEGLCLSDGEDDGTMLKHCRRKSMENWRRDVVKVEVASLEQLEEVITRSGVDTKCFESPKTKTMSDLWREYSTGKLEWSQTQKGVLMRCITVLKVRIFWEAESAGTYMLEEFRQMRSDGQTRDIHRPPSKILGIGESLGAAASRCLKEELGIDVAVFGLELDLDDIRTIEEERESTGYPGLPTKYRIQEVSGKLLNGTGAEKIGLPSLTNFESQDQKDHTGCSVTHFWTWRQVAGTGDQPGSNRKILNRHSTDTCLEPQGKNVDRRASGRRASLQRGVKRSVTLTLDTPIAEMNSKEGLGKDEEDERSDSKRDPTIPIEEQWRHNLGNRRSSANGMGIFMMKSPFQLEECLKSFGVPTDLFGKGKAKTLLELWEEYLTNKLIFEKNEEGKLVRRVKVLKVRIVAACSALGDRSLVELGQHLPGRQRDDFDPPKLPAKIMYAAESIESGIARCVKEELKVDEIFIKVALDIDLKDVKNWEESCLSRGYPGLLTIYDLCEVRVRVKTPANIEFALGLPDMKDFQTYDETGNSNRGITHYWGWRREEDAK